MMSLDAQWTAGTDGGDVGLCIFVEAEAEGRVRMETRQEASFPVQIFLEP